MDCVSILSVTLATAPLPGAGAPPNGLNAGSLWDLVIKGGWIMVPIGVCSLVALTIIAERLILLRRGRVAPAALLNAVQGSEPERALEQCEVNGSPLAEVLAVTIRS